MYAIIKLGGKQYKIFEKSIIKVEKINLNLNSLLILNKILFISDELTKVIIDKLILEKLFIISRIIFHGRSEKINIFKMKRRKHFKKWKSHKQTYSKIIIEKFNFKF